MTEVLSQEQIDQLLRPSSEKLSWKDRFIRTSTVRTVIRLRAQVLGRIRKHRLRSWNKALNRHWHFILNGIYGHRKSSRIPPLLKKVPEGKRVKTVFRWKNIDFIPDYGICPKCGTVQKFQSITEEEYQRIPSLEDVMEKNRQRRLFRGNRNSLVYRKKKPCSICRKKLKPTLKYAVRGKGHLSPPEQTVEQLVDWHNQYRKFWPRFFQESSDTIRKKRGKVILYWDNVLTGRTTDLEHLPEYLWPSIIHYSTRLDLERMLRGHKRIALFGRYNFENNPRLR